MKSHPIFRMTVGSSDVTTMLASRMLSLTVVDNAGSEADSFNLRLDDTKTTSGGNNIPMPVAGDSVEIEMGYEDTGLVYLGEFFIDEVILSADPAWEMEVRGESANMNSSLKTLRSQAWDNKTIGDIVTEIAGRNNLTPVISPELAGILIEHIDQMTRSDMAFLQRLAVDYSAVFKVIEGQAVFALAGQNVSVTGQNITDMVIRPDENVHGWKVLHQHRGRFSTLSTRHHDYETGETMIEQAPGMPDGNGSDRIHTRRHPTPEEAQAAAASEARRLAATSAKLSIQLVGEPRLSAEGSVILQGFRDGVDGNWKIKSVTHEFANGGLTTTVSGEVPTANGAGAGGSAVDLNNWVDQ
jgi:phage protein D